MVRTPQDSELDPEFLRLLNAVLTEPEKVPAIVRGAPEILEVTDTCGETVLHWLAVENQFDGVRLLHCLGAAVPYHAVVHAIDVGHTEMVVTLLDLGVDMTGFDYDRYVDIAVLNLSKEQKRLIRNYFSQFGYQPRRSVENKRQHWS